MSTLQDVAAHAGVHISTASRILNCRGDGMVSPATRQRVLEAAAMLQYRPSAAASALASGRTWVLAVHCARPYDPHVMPVLRELHHICAARGYHLQIATEWAQLHDWLRERRADVVVNADVVDDDGELLASVGADHQRILSCGPSYRTVPEGVVCGYWRDADGVRSALRHLLELGHRHIALLAGTEHSAKVETYEAAAVEYDFQPLVVRSDDEDDVLAAGAAMARRLLEAEPRPTAIFARNDEFAFGALHVLREGGLCVPEDISLVGYSDIAASAYTSPSLTTVRTPLVECVRALLPSVLNSIGSGADERLPGRAVAYSTTLIVRSSTAPPRST